MAKRFAVLGSPIQHSKSPTIHQAAYRLLGLDSSYERFEVMQGELEGFLSSTDLDGFSVTMPLKEEALSLSASADSDAVLAGAANTLLRKGQEWHAFNTDVFGLSKALRQANLDRVLVIGSGATARNALINLSRSGVSKVTILARNEAALGTLHAFALGLGLNVETTVGPVQLGEFETTVSTVPAGSKVDEWLLGAAKGTLLDVAYNPWPSTLATRWQADGGNLISGIEMLIWQAIAQIRVFLTGSAAEALPNEEELYAVMRAAASGN